VKSDQTKTQKEDQATTQEAGDHIALDTPVQFIAGVGPRKAKRFANIGITTVGALIKHLPMRYEFEFDERPIDSLVPDEIGYARGELITTRLVGRGRKARFEATLQDASGRLLLTWFAGAYLRHKLHPGSIIQVHGKVKDYRGYLQMVNPKWSPTNLQHSQLQDNSDDDISNVDEQSMTLTRVEDVKQNTDSENIQNLDLDDGRLQPVYPATEQLTSMVIRETIHKVLDIATQQIEEHLPEDLRHRRALPTLANAYRMIHQPQSEDEVANARRRIAYDELLFLQLGVAMRRHQLQADNHAIPLVWNDVVDSHIRNLFSFEFTASQNTVVDEIRTDLANAKPMNRLLQGDVGSGKTAVALYAILLAINSGTQAALLAPTEILAEQHYTSISNLLENSKVHVELMTGKMAAAERKDIATRLANGDIDLIIGTHALLSKSTVFKQLALVVIDEQHRFGVEQRAILREATTNDSQQLPTIPHTLVMTATPIPRTLSLTVFGDLDISTISELPPGRTPIITRVVQPVQSEKVYQYIAERLAKGEQAYIVVPVIEESANADLKDLRSHMDTLEHGILHQFHLAALHGRLKRETRERIMDRFRRKKIDALIATTVIEVGIDVPNATMMIIEHAERFGLAQLHQLRGRVGRGEDQSLCVLIAKPTTGDASQRIDAIAATNDGFIIAEKDFEIRGMGEIFGTRQSGIAPFKAANLPKDFGLLRIAREDAMKLIALDPVLIDNQRHILLRKRFMKACGKYFNISDVA